MAQDSVKQGGGFDEETAGCQTSPAAPTPHAWDEQKEPRKATVLVDGNHQHHGSAQHLLRRPKLRRKR